MSLIIGIIVSAITFPGIIVHEFAHQIFCKLTKTKVLEVCYLRFKLPAGYVIHEKPKNAWSSILISFGPFLVNSTIAFVVGFSGMHFFLASESFILIFLLLVWLAISIGTHSFPSIGDAKNIWKHIWEKSSSISSKIIGTPLVLVIFIGSILSVFWMDVIYGVFIAIIIPSLLSGSI